MAAFLQSGCTAAILGRLQDADYAAAQTQTASLETPTEGLPAPMCRFGQILFRLTSRTWCDRHSGSAAYVRA